MYSSGRHSHFMNNWSSFGLVWRYEELGLHILVWIWILYRFILKCLNLRESRNFMFVNLIAHHECNQIPQNSVSIFSSLWNLPWTTVPTLAMPFNLCEFNNFPMWSRFFCVESPKAHAMNFIWIGIHLQKASCVHISKFDYIQYDRLVVVGWTKNKINSMENSQFPYVASIWWLTAINIINVTNIP